MYIMMLYARKCNIKRIVQRDSEELRRFFFRDKPIKRRVRVTMYAEESDRQRDTVEIKCTGEGIYVDKLNVRRHFCSRTSCRRYNNYNTRTCAQDIIMCIITIAPLHRCLMASCCTLHTHTHPSHR